MDTFCSTLFILSMTFGRFYSIIRPHKAASFNTVKRAKITIVCIVMFSIPFNVPHLFVTGNDGRQCVPFGRALDKVIGLFYYWLSFVIYFVVPFVLLLIMNSVIIHTLRNRSKFKRSEGQGQSEQAPKIKNSDMQVFAILLLVTFTFLVVTTPAYCFFLYTMFYNYNKSPRAFAEFNIFYHFAQKGHFTNYGINFFLYVISGQKFRSDLINLFRRHRGRQMITSTLNVSTITTASSLPSVSNVSNVNTTASPAPD